MDVLPAFGVIFGCSGESPKVPFSDSFGDLGSWDTGFGHFGGPNQTKKEGYF